MNLIRLLVLVFISYQISALPGFSNNVGDCEISYYHFCDELGENTFNMCPKKLSPRLKDICVLNSNQVIDVKNSCQKEITSICKPNSSKEFLFNYACIVNPKNWPNVSKKCLDAIGSSHKHSSKKQKI